MAECPELRRLRRSSLDELKLAVACLLYVCAVLDSVAVLVECDVAGNAALVVELPECGSDIDRGHIGTLFLCSCADSAECYIVSVKAESGYGCYDIVAAVHLELVGIICEPLLEAGDEVACRLGGGIGLVEEGGAVDIKIGAFYSVENYRVLPCVACHDRACDADIVCVLEQVSRNGCGVGGEDHGSLLVDSLLQVIGEVGRVLYEGLHYNLTAELFKGGLKVACETERVGVAFLRENVCDGLIAGGLVAVGGGLVRIP